MKALCHSRETKENVSNPLVSITLQGRETFFLKNVSMNKFYRNKNFPNKTLIFPEKIPLLLKIRY